MPTFASAGIGPGEDGSGSWLRRLSGRITHYLVLPGPLAVEGSPADAFAMAG